MAKDKTSLERTILLATSVVGGIGGYLPRSTVSPTRYGRRSASSPGSTNAKDPGSRGSTTLRRRPSRSSDQAVNLSARLARLIRSIGRRPSSAAAIGLRAVPRGLVGGSSYDEKLRHRSGGAGGARRRCICDFGGRRGAAFEGRARAELRGRARDRPPLSDRSRQPAGANDPAG